MTRSKTMAWMLAGSLLLKTVLAAETEDDVRPVQFQLATAAEYTDNRDSTEKEEDNIDLFLKPRVDISFYVEERGKFDFYYIPAFRYRTEPRTARVSGGTQEIENDTIWQHDLALRGEYKMAPRLRLILDEKLDITDDPSVVQGDTTLTRSGTFILNRVQAGANYLITPDANIELMGRNWITRYDDPEVAQESDKDQTGVQATSWTRMSRTLAFLAMADAGVYDFESQVLNLDRGFTVMTGALGLEQLFNSGLRGRFFAGMQSVEYSDSTLGSDTSPFFEGQLRGTLSPATRIIADANYRIKDADVYPFASQEFTELSLRTEWDRDRYLTLALSGAYRISHYDENDVPESFRSRFASDEALRQLADNLGRDTSGDQNVLVLTVEATYKIGDKNSIKLIQRYEDADSDVSESFTRNSTYLAFSRQF